jgi:hypothetical protein
MRAAKPVKCTACNETLPTTEFFKTSGPSPICIYCETKPDDYIVKCSCCNEPVDVGDLALMEAYGNRPRRGKLCPECDGKSMHERRMIRKQVKQHGRVIKCPCGKLAEDEFRGKPICADCMRDDSDLNINTVMERQSMTGNYYEGL